MSLTTGGELRQYNFYKILMPHRIHHHFLWREGENTDTLPFSPSDYCSAGGLYFCEFRNLAHHASNDYRLLDHWVGNVELRDDEPVWCEPEVIAVRWPNKAKWKAHRVTLSKLRRVSNLHDEQLFTLALNHYNMYVPWDQHDIEGSWFRLLERTQERYTLGFIKNPSQRHYRLAFGLPDDDWSFASIIEKEPRALRYLKPQTVALCVLALDQWSQLYTFVDPSLFDKVMEELLHKNPMHYREIRTDIMVRDERIVNKEDFNYNTEQEQEEENNDKEE